MQTVSSLYREITKGYHWKEILARIGGSDFGLAQIVSLSTSSSLYAEDKPMIGSCVSAEVDISYLYGGIVPPRMAKIELFVRVANSSAASEWLPKGVFYADTRVIDEEAGIYTIHGYDAMLKAEQPFLGKVVTGDWPRSAPEVAAEIAERMGVNIDSRTVLRSDVMVPYPLDYTCREILGQIAVAHAGNWIITDAGELRLIGLTEIPKETNLLVNEAGETIMLGEVAIIV